MAEKEVAARVILIGGTSNVGKSTLARTLGQRLGRQQISTDSLARHPGRPWQRAPLTVPPHVAEHYLSLSVDQLIASVLAHYQSMWPGIAALVTTRATDRSTEPLILEGSALWPASVASLALADVAALWLTASDDLLHARIYHESRYAEADARGREMIDAFLARTRRYNALMMQIVTSLHLPCIEVAEGWSIDVLTNHCLALLSKGD